MLSINVNSIFFFYHGSEGNAVFCCDLFFQPELAMVLYPMFVHMYLELVYKGSEKEGEY